MARYTRHELKEDRFAATTAETLHWAVRHRRTLLTAGIAIVVAILAAVGYFAWMTQRDQAASLEMGRAVRMLDAPIQPEAERTPEIESFTSAGERAQAARNAFQRVVDEFPRTRQSEIARYFVGITSLQAGDTPRGEETLREVAGSRNRDLASLAKFALAAHFRAAGNREEAARLYREIVDSPTRSVPRATAQLELAATLQPTDPAEANRIYEQIRQDNPPQSEAARIATSRLEGTGQQAQ